MFLFIFTFRMKKRPIEGYLGKWGFQQGIFGDTWTPRGHLKNIGGETFDRLFENKLLFHNVSKVQICNQSRVMASNLRHKTHLIPWRKFSSSHLSVVFAQSIENRCYVENEDKVGAAPRLTFITNNKVNHDKRAYLATWPLRDHFQNVGLEKSRKVKNRNFHISNYHKW